MKPKTIRIIIFLVLFMGLTGCTKRPLEPNLTEPINALLESTEALEFKSEPTVEATTELKIEKTMDALILDQVKTSGMIPNELGEIMIVMYHNLAKENSSYARTVASFKDDLEQLYKKGYRLISMADFISGKIDVPFGYTPIVLTFDDGHRTNFNFIQGTEGNWHIDPECVIGILEAFTNKYPDFGKAAVFYLNAGNPFGQPEFLVEKLQFLYENGYEIGNHAYNHEDLSKLDGDGIQIALGRNVKHFKEIYPELHLRTLALPYGKSTQNRDLKPFISKGSFESIAYENEISLLVGWRPTLPFYAIGFDHTAVHRVQSGDGDMQLTWWLDVFDESPERRFVSDGVSDWITVPLRVRESLDPLKVDMEKVLIVE